jgi:hypothetical protein
VPRNLAILLLLPVFLAGQTPTVTSIAFLQSIGDSIQGVAVDSAGNVYITGNTSGNIPLVNALQSKPGGGNCSPYPSKNFQQCPNIFVAKLDPTGAKLIYSTYVSGDQSDYAAGIAVDPAGNAYVAGTTIPAGFRPSSSIPPLGNTFVKKLSPDGSTLLYTRYIGGQTGAFGIAVDANGNASITGFNLGDFPGVNPLPVQPL